MARQPAGPAGIFSRRAFLANTGGALMGVSALALAGQATAAVKRHPQRGGILRYSSRGDTAGLDGHKHNQFHASHPTSVIYSSLTDLDYEGNIIPGIAESWEPSKDLKSWVFRLRKGVLFHNGREVDAESVKLNLERIKNPAIGGQWERGAIDTIERAEVIDRYTIRIHATLPDVTVPSSVMHYPTRLIAPDAFDTASEHPVGTGPFKFVSWARYNETRLVRFENYWETDAEGHHLPYLDEIIGKPKREDSVRLTALLTNQVQLIDSMANADVERFTQRYRDTYNIWNWHLGGRLLVFNFRRGPFQDKRLRTAAAYAIDREAIHHSVYYGIGSMNNQPYPEGNRWHMDGIRMPEYDPERAKALLKEARAIGTPVRIVCSSNIAQSRESGQVLQNYWNAVGFKATVEPLDSVPFRQARAKGTFDGLVNGHSYRYDPDDFYGRNLHSQSQYAQILSGWKHERFDHLIDEAKKTLDAEKRKAMYTEAWNIVNDELPHYYLHEELWTSAATKDVQGYQPSRMGALQYQSGGLRTAYINA